MSNSPRLMLVSPVLGPDSDFTSALDDALGGAEIAALVLRVDREAEERAVLKMLKPLVEAAQAKGAAVLIEGAPDLVGKSGADGAHVLGEAQAREAISRFKPEKIIGVGGLRSRDAAMNVGELGPDYLLFGDPGKGGEAPPVDTVAERAAWWAEIFTVPCVAQTETFEDVAALAATDAEFVALGSFVWTHPDGAGEAVRTASDANEKAGA